MVAMSLENAKNLKQYYAKKYGTPKSKAQTINNLAKIYQDIMDLKFITMEIREGIAEYFRLISERNLPAYEWLLEAFHVVSKKEIQKRHFPYVVGVLREWLKNGFGYIPTDDHTEVIDFFEEVTGTHSTTEARLQLQELMGKFGAVRVTRNIAGFLKDHDVSLVMARFLGDSMKERYTEQDEPIDKEDVSCLN